MCHDKWVMTGGAAPTFEQIRDFSKEGADQSAGPTYSDLRSEASMAESTTGAGAIKQHKGGNYGNFRNSNSGRAIT